MRFYGFFGHRAPVQPLYLAPTALLKGGPAPWGATRTPRGCGPRAPEGTRPAATEPQVPRQARLPPQEAVTCAAGGPLAPSASASMRQTPTRHFPCPTGRVAPHGAGGEDACLHPGASRVGAGPRGNFQPPVPQCPPLRRDGGAPGDRPSPGIVQRVTWRLAVCALCQPPTSPDTQHPPRAPGRPGEPGGPGGSQCSPGAGGCGWAGPWGGLGGPGWLPGKEEGVQISHVVLLLFMAML